MFCGRNDMVDPDLIKRLASYISFMAPHHKEREGGRLLIDAYQELEKLNDKRDVSNGNPNRPNIVI
jgi:hypothetical protein